MVREQRCWLKFTLIIMASGLQSNFIAINFECLASCYCCWSLVTIVIDINLLVITTMWVFNNYFFIKVFIIIYFMIDKVFCFIT